MSGSCTFPTCLSCPLILSLCHTSCQERAEGCNPLGCHYLHDFSLSPSLFSFSAPHHPHCSSNPPCALLLVSTPKITFVLVIFFPLLHPKGTIQREPSKVDQQDRQAKARSPVLRTPHNHQHLFPRSRITPPPLPLVHICSHIIHSRFP